jgi:hypothetical protein
MKAKIKKTGEIVNIAEYAKITLEQCDSYGNPIELKPEEVELIQEPTENEHWQYIRECAAIAAMQGTITILGSSDRYAFRDVVVEGYKGNEKTYPNEIAQFAVACADALIEELKKE